MTRKKPANASSSAELHAAVNVLRDRIADLVARRKGVSETPDAASIEASIRRTLRNDMPVSLAGGFDPSHLIFDPKNYGGLERLFKSSPLAAMAVILGEDVVANSLVAHGLAAAKAEGGCVSREDRAAQLALIDEDLSEAEREEERLCREAENSSFPIERRAKANPMWLIADDRELEVDR